MAPELIICCGREPIEQRSHGRRVRFCIGCGKEYDVGAATIRERMHDEQLEICRAGEIRTPAVMMRHTDLVRGVRRR